MRTPIVIRKPHGVSASSVGRAFLCGYWARGEHDWIKLPGDELAERGTVGHAAVEALLAGRKAPEVHPAVAECALRAVEWVRAERLDMRGVEQAMYLDVERQTSRLVKLRAQRRYADYGASEIPMTADLFAVDPSGNPVVVDWKFRPPGVGTRGQVEHHRDQLFTLGVGWWLATGAPNGVVRVVAVKLTPKRALPTEWLLNVEELGAYALRLRELMRGLRDARPVAGDEQCRYCHLASSLSDERCPAFQAREASLAEADSLFTRR